jgi:plastocyanin
MKNSIPGFKSAWVLTVGLALAACSSDSAVAAGVGGSAGDASGPAAICGCTQATAEDDTTSATVTVSFGGALGPAYAPKCVAIKVGTVVTFSGDFAMHPLRPSPTVSAPGNPIVDVGPADAGASASFTFASTGSFGYRCLVHGTEDAGMCGAVYVLP